MIIGTCGFISTGSSAVSDYLKEFEDICVLDSWEFPISYFPDGLEDLDYHLNFSCSKYMSSTVALERFRMYVYNNLCKKGISKKQKKKIINAAENFIQSVTQVKWKGRGDADYQLYCGVNYKKGISLFFYKTLKRMQTIIYKVFKYECNFYPIHNMEFAINPEKFEDKAQKFVKDILTIYGADFSKKIVLDQPYAGNNPQKSFKFFDNPIAIVVDRDPRDHYLFNKIFLRKKGLGMQVPTDDVRDYVTYYRQMRLNQPYNYDDSILKISFEDMIYKYDETVKKINIFCDLNLEKRKKKIFVPELSINNTQLFKRYPQYSSDISYIEENLKEYLYPFEQFEEVEITGEMFFGKSPLNR